MKRDFFSPRARNPFYAFENVLVYLWPAHVLTIHFMMHLKICELVKREILDFFLVLKKLKMFIFGMDMKERKNFF